MDQTNIPRTLPRQSATFDPHTMAEIRRAAATGIYDIRGAGTKRALPVPSCEAGSTATPTPASTIATIVAVAALS